MASKKTTKRGRKPTKKTATSKKGNTYKRSSKSETGWVKVREYRRTKPTRRATKAEQKVHACASTRKAKYKKPRASKRGKGRKGGKK